VSEDPAHGASKIRASKGDHEGGGGGAGKWLLGAVAAAVIVGGGYYAYTHLPSAQSDTQTAYNDTYADDEPLRAGPLSPSDDIRAESAMADEEAAPAPQSARRASAPRRTTTASTDAVPEETIGITPVNATTTVADGEDIVVTAPQRPVWAQVPSARRLSALYPSRALDRGREGEASLHCMVLDGGALDCSKVSETPGGGFGNAAMRVARNLRHASTTRDGRDAVGTPVNLRVVFRIDDEDMRRG
jgi:TonB family protein